MKNIRIRFNCVYCPFHGWDLFKILIVMQQKMLDKYGHIYLYEVAVGFQFKESHVEEKWNAETQCYYILCIAWFNRQNVKFLWHGFFACGSIFVLLIHKSVVSKYRACVNQNYFETKNLIFHNHIHKFQDYKYVLAFV